MELKVNDRKTISAWTMYDWANSVYPLVITSAIFPIFYEKSTDENVFFFGREFVNTEIYSYVISFSYILVAFLSPLLSGVADYSGAKKSYMRFFCYLGALSCMSLYFFNADYLEWSMLSILFASIGFSGSLVFYNAYLPEIATPRLHDRVSAAGYARGYVGASLLLIICLVLMMVFGYPAKLSFALTGLWWLLFSQITFKGLPNNIYHRKVEGNRFTEGFKELQKVWKLVKQLTSLKRYLASFFLYNMGVQTVMIMAVFFGTKEIKWASEKEMQTGLIISILLIQFIAVAGAHLMASLSYKYGNIKTLGLVVLLWVFICISAYLLVHEPIHFYIIAAVIGLVMGGIQSLSRSTYSKMLPETQDHASYFSFYDVLEKLGIVIGTFSFGFIESFFSIRESVLALIVFFILGFLMLLRVPEVTTSEE